MDEVLIACYTHMNNYYGCTVDEILVDPIYRNQFLNMVSLCFVDEDEKIVLKRLINLRKQSKLPSRRFLYPKREIVE